MDSEDICKGCGHTYQRLPLARSGLCCNCRKISREERKSTKRKFTNDPAAFQNQDALDEWHNHDALLCHICGNSFPGLYRHAPLAHGIAVRDYKQRFGIPMTYSLAGKATREKHAACGRATSAKMAACNFSNLAHGRAAKTGVRTAWVPYQATEHAARMVESPGHPSNYEGDMELTCRECGSTYEVPASIGLSRQCRAKCPSCKR